MQERVTFEKEIRLAMQQKEAEERDPDDPEEDVEDPDEWWRLLQDGGEQESYVPNPSFPTTTHHFKPTA